MSWQDIKSRYENGGGLVSQSTEDMVARRILRALGITGEKLRSVERLCGTDRDRKDDTTLYERAVAVGKEVSALFNTARTMDVKSRKEAKKALLDIAEGYGYRIGDVRVTLFYRAGSAEPRALTVFRADTMISIGSLPNGCTVEPDEDDVFVDSDVVDYVKSAIRGRSMPWTS